MEQIKLDWTLETVQERINQISELLATISFKPNKTILERMTDYIYAGLSSKEAKQLGLLSNNSLKTINKREVSFESLTDKFENGNEDMIYNFMANSKNIKLTQKQKITEQDLQRYPELKQLRKNIDTLEELYKIAKGKKKFLLKSHIIQLQQEQQIIKNQNSGGRDLLTAAKATSAYTRMITKIDLNEDITFDDNGEPTSNGKLSLFNYKHIYAILSNYSMLKQELETSQWDDFYYLMLDFDKVAAAALRDYPLYEDIITWRIDGNTHAQIADLIFKKQNQYHTAEQISTLWTTKIPKIIAEKAKEEYLLWYYTNIERGKWKKCSKCGQIKLAHNRFFSKNKSGKDGFYSVCKECRNKKRKADDLF